MKKDIMGLTIIELLISIVFFAVVAGSILGIFIVVQRYFKDGVAMISSQATASILIEKMARPEIREGRAFNITDEGNTLTVTRYDSTVNVFSFNNGDGNDATFSDNTIKENGNIIGSNITKILGKDVFESLKENEIVGINYGVKNEGLAGHYKEIYISTKINLRN